MIFVFTGLCMIQAIVNSVITPTMMFTKTSQKFGQWSDARANTVYGLGFASESQLTKVFLHCIELCSTTLSFNQQDLQ